MAGINDIEEVIIGVAGYSFYQRMLAKHGQLNVLFYGALFILIAIAVFLGSFQAFINWDADGTWDKIKVGDKLYVDDYYFEKGNRMGNYYQIEQLALPITEHDIDTMDIPAWQKDKFKYELDTTLKPKLVQKSVVLWVDSMYKYKTAFLGTCVGKDSLSKFDDIINRWFAIEPNKKFADFESIDSVPDNYILQNKYYISLTAIQTQEAKPFLKSSQKRK